MYRPTIAVKTQARDYAGLLTLGGAVYEGMSENAWFPEPGVPLTMLKSGIDQTWAAIGQWGPANNRGSHADLIDLRLKARTLKLYIMAEAAYVQSVAQIIAQNDYPLMASIISSSAFPLRRNNTRQGVLEKVQNLQLTFPPSLNRNQVKLEWDKPLNLNSRHNVRSYLVFRGTTPDITAAVRLETISKTWYIDRNDTGGVQTYFYWIIPFNYAGKGAVSDMMTVTLLGK